MPNWRILSHPLNWLNVAAILVFWLALAYVLANQLHLTLNQSATTQGQSP